MRIGMFGGTFDPPHNAHIKLAQWVRKELSLDYIYFIPAACHAFKNNADVTPAEIRFQMILAATVADEALKVSRIELDREGVSFTVDTLRDFARYEKIPDAQLYYIIGIDNLYDFHRWKDPDGIMELATLVVIKRLGGEETDIFSEFKDKILFLESPIIDISSTRIREEVRSGKYNARMMPESVLRIIKDLGLYKTRAEAD